MSVDPTAVSSFAGGLPPISETALPAAVRNGTKAQKQAYEAALGFERMLVGELTKSMLATAQTDPASSGDDASGDDSSSDSTGSDATTSMYQQMLPDQIANAVTSAGGTGLAQQIYTSLEGKPR